MRKKYFRTYLFFCQSDQSIEEVAKEFENAAEMIRRHGPDRLQRKVNIVEYSGYGKIAPGEKYEFAGGTSVNVIEFTGEPTDGHVVERVVEALCGRDDDEEPYMEPKP